MTPIECGSVALFCESGSSIVQSASEGEPAIHPKQTSNFILTLPRVPYHRLKVTSLLPQRQNQHQFDRVRPSVRQGLHALVETRQLAKQEYPFKQKKGRQRAICVQSVLLAATKLLTARLTPTLSVATA